MKKTFKRSLLTMVAFMLLGGMLLTGCTTENPGVNPGTSTPTGDDPTEAPTGGDPTEEPTEEPTEAPTEAPTPQGPTMTIGGVDISNFVIVYEAPADKSTLGNYWRDDFDGGKQTAKALAAMIKEKFGVDVAVVQDVGGRKSANEILIGKTNRTESNAAKGLGFDDYYIGMKDGKLVVRGYSMGVTWHALDEFKALFEATPANGTCAIPADFERKGQYHLDNIAILGDSITYGALSTNYTQNGGLFGYAKTFARMNWRDCRVTVYATPGICLRTDLNGFMTNSLWTQFTSRSKGDKFDVLMVMLGTNDGYTDAGPTTGWNGVWTAEDDASFLKTMDDLATAAIKLNPGLKTVFLSCPVYYRSGDPSSPYYHTSHYHVTPHTIELQKQGVESMRAKGMDVHLFDMNLYTTEKTPATMYSDLLHPNDEGHFIMAQGVYAMYPLFKNGETNKYLIN